MALAPSVLGDAISTNLLWIRRHESRVRVGRLYYPDRVYAWIPPVRSLQRTSDDIFFSMTADAAVGAGRFGTPHRNSPSIHPTLSEKRPPSRPLPHRAPSAPGVPLLRLARGDCLLARQQQLGALDNRHVDHLAVHRHRPDPLGERL